MSTPTSQQFEGTTIEEALANAVEMFGDDLEIIDAQRVRRRRMLGVRRQDRFEVTVTKKSTVEPRGFEDVLARMVDRVDEAERSLGSDLADTDRAWWSEAEFVVPPQEAATPPPRRDVAQAVVDVRHEPAVQSQQGLTVDDLIGRSRGEGTAGEAPAMSHAPQPAVAEPAPRRGVIDHSAAPVWSADALLELGLPPALIGRIRLGEDAADLDWVGALANAITELLDTATSLSGPCELTGHGAESAVHLIRGACDGFRVGAIVVDGKQLPATPLELALAVRSLLRAERVGAS